MLNFKKQVSRVSVNLLMYSVLADQ